MYGTLPSAFMVSLMRKKYSQIKI